MMVMMMISLVLCFIDHWLLTYYYYYYYYYQVRTEVHKLKK